MSMKHMDMPWRIEYFKSDKSWSIIAGTEFDWWYVATVHKNLPGDSTGRATAEAICAEHNAALAARKGSK